MKVLNSGYKLLSAIVLMALAQTAFAQTGGLNDFFVNMSETFKTAVLFLQYFFFLVGIAFFGWVGMDLKKMSNANGQKPEMVHIVYKIIGGVVCVAVGAVAQFSKKSLLGSEADEQVEFSGAIKM